MLLYALTVFLGSFLLFQVQPILGKAVLPWFGGVPAVWSTCLVFFQLVLLAGYFYAHGLARFLTGRTARVMHIALVLVSLAVLAALAFDWGSPILPGNGWKPIDPARPVTRIVAILAASVGLPYLLLSATSPLVQAWASRTHPGTRVYRLYALSNLGSLLALATYPTLVERFLSLRSQAWIWAVAYAAYAICSIAAVRLSARSLSQSPSLPVPQSSSSLFPHVTDDSPLAQFPIHNSQFTTPSWFSPSPRLPVSPSPRLSFWFLLAACGSMMLMATTNQMCQEVAAIPFLWVLPLCLYLATFILCFQSERFYKRAVFGLLFVGASCWAAVVLFKGFPVSIQTQIAAYSAALFAACMICHGELARSKPEPDRLTSFYLTISAGGAAGGIFVALIAPLVFRGFWELHLGLVLSGVLAIAALVRDRSSWLYRRRPWPALVVLAACAAVVYYTRDPELFRSGLARWLSFRMLISSGSGLLALGGGIAAVVLILKLRLLTAPGRPVLAAALLAGALAFVAMLLVSEIQSSLVSAVSISRNFYGVLTVERLAVGVPESERLDLRHGRIVHGFQYWSPEKRREPTTYYGENSGIGLALEHHPGRKAGPLRVGVVGLGVGTIAAYGRAGDLYRFYDINPQVIALSTGPGRLFSYLADCPARVEIAPGDARLSLERELSLRDSPRYDVLAIDAFTSDAIPVHLLTREAIAIDLDRLAAGGVLALHISNRQLDLEPVVRKAASSLSLPICVVDRNEKSEAVWATTWVLLSRDPSALADPDIASACVRRETRSVRLWTDDYSSLLPLLK